jgi:hypothetical protein
MTDQLENVTAEQQWSSYCHEAGSGVRFLQLLARFATELIDGLEKTWRRLALDDAVRGFVFLLSERKRLLHFIKSQTSPDEKAGAVAARVLEVLSFSTDLREVELSGAVVNGFHLQAVLSPLERTEPIRSQSRSWPPDCGPTRTDDSTPLRSARRTMPGIRLPPRLR